MEDFKNKSLDELRINFILGHYDTTVITDEMSLDIKRKILFEKAQNNPNEFLNSLLKLTSLVDAHSKLPYKIDKIKVLEYVKNELVNKKAFEIAMRNSGISNIDPINTIINIEIYELLLEYLENDKTINPTDCDSKYLTK